MMVKHDLRLITASITQIEIAVRLVAVDPTIIAKYRAWLHVTLQLTANWDDNSFSPLALVVILCNILPLPYLRMGRTKANMGWYAEGTFSKMLAVNTYD